MQSVLLLVIFAILGFVSAQGRRPVYQYRPQQPRLLPRPVRPQSQPVVPRRPWRNMKRESPAPKKDDIDMMLAELEQQYPEVERVGSVDEWLAPRPPRRTGSYDMDRVMADSVENWDWTY